MKLLVILAVAGIVRGDISEKLRQGEGAKGRPSNYGGLQPPIFGSGLKSESASPPRIVIPSHHGDDDEDNLERLCNDPFHSFLCKPVGPRKYRIDGNLRPGAILPQGANLNGASSNLKESKTPLTSGGALLSSENEGYQYPSPSNSYSYEKPKPNEQLVLPQPSNQNGYKYEKPFNPLPFPSQQVTTKAPPPGPAYQYLPALEPNDIRSSQSIQSQEIVPKNQFSKNVIQQNFRPSTPFPTLRTTQTPNYFFQTKQQQSTTHRPNYSFQTKQQPLITTQKPNYFFQTKQQVVTTPKPNYFFQTKQQTLATTQRPNYFFQTKQQQLITTQRPTYFFQNKQQTVATTQRPNYFFQTKQQTLATTQKPNYFFQQINTTPKPQASQNNFQGKSQISQNQYFQATQVVSSTTAPEYLPPVPQASFVQSASLPSKEYLPQEPKLPQATFQSPSLLPSKPSNEYLPSEGQSTNVEGQALLPDEIDPLPNQQKPRKHERNHTLEELCNEAFHSFLCKPIKSPRKRIDGNIRPGAKIPPHVLLGAGSSDQSAQRLPPTTTTTQKPIIEGQALLGDGIDAPAYPGYQYQIPQTFFDSTNVRNEYSFPNPFFISSASDSLSLAKQFNNIKSLSTQTFAPPTTQKFRPIVAAGSNQLDFQQKASIKQGYDYKKPIRPLENNQNGYFYPKPTTVATTTTELTTETTTLESTTYATEATTLKEVIPDGTNIDEKGYSYPQPQKPLTLPTKKPEGYFYTKPPKAREFTFPLFKPQGSSLPFGARLSKTVKTAQKISFEAPKIKEEDDDLPPASQFEILKP